MDRPAAGSDSRKALPDGVVRQGLSPPRSGQSASRRGLETSRKWLDITQGRIQFEIADDFEVDPPLGDTARKFAAARCRLSARNGLAYLLETRPNRFAIGAISSGLAANQPATTTTMATMNQIRPAQPSMFVPANI